MTGEFSETLQELEEAGMLRGESGCEKGSASFCWWRSGVFVLLIAVTVAFSGDEPNNAGVPSTYSAASG